VLFGRYLDASSCFLSLFYFQRKYRYTSVHRMSVVCHHLCLSVVRIVRTGKQHHLRIHADVCEAQAKKVVDLVRPTSETGIQPSSISPMYWSPAPRHMIL